MTWTAEMKQTVFTDWDAGLTATQISAKLGGAKSRNAIIGMVNRNQDKVTRTVGRTAEEKARNISEALKGVTRKPRKKVKKVKLKKVEKITPKAVVDLAEPDMRKVPIGSEGCKFIFTEVPEGYGHEHLYCGNACLEKQNYCAHHWDRMTIGKRGYKPSPYKPLRIAS